MYRLRVVTDTAHKAQHITAHARLTGDLPPIQQGLHPACSSLHAKAAPSATIPTSGHNHIKCSQMSHNGEQFRIKAVYFNQQSACATQFKGLVPVGGKSLVLDVVGWLRGDRDKKLFQDWDHTRNKQTDPPSTEAAGRHDKTSTQPPRRPPVVIAATRMQR